MTNEYRVVWNRVGCSTKTKIYATKRGAERFMTLLGPQPWLACGYSSADEYVCCGGMDCGCGGETIGASLAAKFADTPMVASLRLVKTISAYESPTRPTRLHAISLAQLDAIVTACESTLSEFLAGSVASDPDPGSEEVMNEKAAVMARNVVAGECDFSGYATGRSSLAVEHTVRLP